MPPHLQPECRAGCCDGGGALRGVGAPLPREMEWSLRRQAAEGDRYGHLVRRGVGEARGEVIVVVDPELPYPVGAIGDAVAMIESGATEIVLGTARPVGSDAPGNFLVRALLVPTLPDPAVYL